ncbi:hypothetical protein [Aquibium sp. ELW1220]|uniref:hypothetical protein n=1 Tax=Aquibium sp. ELW1220 TaxID=2976766 RepID=UPI0025B187E4|nr:hypothetical protein [Aquibium sp. ELW1220]MDN2580873.1 hypothetical protein [Aquibium sp. ELW1220]
MAFPENPKEFFATSTLKKEAKGGIYPYEPLKNDDNTYLIINVAELITEALKGPGIDAYDLADYIVAIVLQGGE